MLAMDVISGLVDPLSNMGKSEAEKQNIRATNKEELAKDFKDMKDSSFVGRSGRVSIWGWMRWYPER